MSEPHEHNPPGFDAPAGGGSGAEGGAGRFWSQYGAARPGRTGQRGANANGGTSEAGERDAHQHECLEWCPICRGVEVMRATTPPELRDQWQTVQRDALVMIRALIDAYLDRLGGSGARDREQRVEDIPID